MRRLLAVLILIALLLLIPRKAAADRDLSACTPEPASQWAPAGYICPPVYGEGWASSWGGPGLAANWCPWPNDCDPVTVTSIDTGRSITAAPVSWCMCWVGVTGPNGETERIVDLDPRSVALLGLDPAKGLWRVTVSPTTTIPDTAMRR